MKYIITLFFALSLLYNNIYAQSVGFTTNEELVCIGDSVFFSDTSSLSVLSWYWDFGDGSISTDQNPVHNYTIEGIYDVRLVVILSGGVVDSIIKTEYIKVIGPSLFNISFIDSMCSGGSASLDLSAIASYNYNSSFIWSNGDTTSNIDSLNTGTYFVTVTVNQCNYQDSVNIGASNSPMLDSLQVLGMDPSCHGNDGSAYVSLYTGQTFSYDDNFDNGNYNSNIWSIVIGGASATSCGSHNGSYALYFNGASSRYAQTNPITFSNNSSVSFYLKYGSSSSSPCEQVDNGEEVQLLYSTNSGSSWTIINTYSVSNYNTFTLITENIPNVALNTNTILKIQQKSNSGSCCDHWAIDGFSINSTNYNGYTFQWDDSLQQTTGVASNLQTGTYNVTITDSFNCTIVDSVTLVPSDPISANILTTGVSCNGNTNGTASALVQGGISPYTYTYNSGYFLNDSSVYNLSEGSYTLVITDSKACIDTFDFNINGPNEPQITLSVVQPSCSLGNNGTISASLNGGNSPFSYLWNTGETTDIISNISSGTYTLSITDSLGCQYDTTISISNIINVNTQIVNSSCYGFSDGYIITSINNPVSPNFLWSNGANSDSIGGLSSGVYYLTVSDSGLCDYVDSFIVTEPDSLLIESQIIDASCNSNNGSIDLTVNGGIFNTGKVLEMTSGSGKSHNDNLYQNISNITPDEVSFYINSSEISLDNYGEAHNYVVLKGSGNLLFFFMGTAENDTIPLMGPIINGSITGSLPISSSSDIVGYAYNPGQWYHVSIKNINYTTQTYNYYVDNNLIFSNVPFNSSTNYVSQIQLYHFNPNTTGYYDEINMSENGTIVFNEDFETNLNSWNLSGSSYTNNLINSNISSSGSYSYYWNSGDTTSMISGLAAGNYTVTVTDDSSCTKTKNFIINDAGTPATNVSVNNVSCSGMSNGSASVSVSGGALPYTYNWSTGTSTTNLSDNFDNGSYNTNIWSSVVGGSAASSCGSYNGTYALYFNGSSSRYAQTQSLNLSNSSSISFYLKYGSSSTSPCEQVDSGEEVELLYSINGGSSWVAVNTYNTISNYTTFTLITENLPTAALSTNTILKIQQKSNSGSSYDQWAIDNIEIMVQTNSTDSFVNNLSPGTIYLTVTDANGCSVYDNAVVQTDTNNLSSSIITTDASCHNTSDGSAQASASGGFPSYNFSWSGSGGVIGNGNAINNLSPGNYTLTITDAVGCTTINQVTISSPPAIYVNAQTISVSCYAGNNGSISLNVSGGSPPYSYTWNNNSSGPNLTSLNAGYYYVTVTDSNNCTETKSISLTQPSQLNVTTSSTTADWNQNNGSASAYVSGGTPSYTYAWSDGQTTSMASNLYSGTYTVTVTDANACVVVATAIVNEDTTGMWISYEHSGHSLNIYPNPFNDYTTISFDNPNRITHYFMLKDINGKTIRYEDNIKDNIYILRKEDLSSGTYMFEFGNNEYSYRGKLVVE